MDANVYVGVWTNWSRGQVLGATVTTTKEYGSLLIAFTAFFIAFVSSRFWRILCLILHRSYSTQEKRDAIYHQRQIVLRNASSPESGLVAFIRLLLAWRKTALKSQARLMPLLLLSVLSLSAFTVAGGFSSAISTSIGDEVLLKPSQCSLIPPYEDININSAVRALYAERLNNAVNYAQQCYNTSSSGALDCGRFRTSHLPTTRANKSADCPFQNDICRTQEDNLRLDTGYIDSNGQLGLNTPTDQRFAWRYVLHCAPLRTSNYTSHIIEDGVGSVRYHYGNMVTGTMDNLEHHDFVYRIGDIDSQYAPLNSSSYMGNNFKVG